MNRIKIEIYDGDQLQSIVKWSDFEHECFVEVCEEFKRFVADGDHALQAVYMDTISFGLEDFEIFASGLNKLKSPSEGTVRLIFGEDQKCTLVVQQYLRALRKIGFSFLSPAGKHVSVEQFYTLSVAKEKMVDTVRILNGEAPLYTETRSKDELGAPGSEKRGEQSLTVPQIAAVREAIPEPLLKALIGAASLVNICMSYCPEKKEYHLNPITFGHWLTKQRKDDLRDAVDKLTQVVPGMPKQYEMLMAQLDALKKENAE